MADLAREFVYRNSVHGAPAGAEKRRQDLPTILSRLYAHEMGKEAEAPRLTCGPRALALHAILKRLGYACRIVSLFSDEYDNVRSHTFVEVQDPATQRWEVQDPDYNVVYVHDEGGQRLSAEDLVLGDPGTVVPVSRRTRGWDGTSTALLRDKFFEALMVHAKDKTEKSVVLVNTDRFSLEKTFPGNGGVTFADFAAERYGHPAIRRNQSVSP
jgi:hypothetical protein